MVRDIYRDISIQTPLCRTHTEITNAVPSPSDSSEDIRRLANVEHALDGRANPSPPRASHAYELCVGL